MEPPWKRITPFVGASASIFEKENDVKHKIMMVLWSMAFMGHGPILDEVSAAPPSNKNPGYEFVTAWGSKGSAPGKFNNVTGIAVAGKEVFVSDARNSRIQVFGLEGNFKRQFSVPGDNTSKLSRPMNLTIQGGEVYVADYLNDRIEVFALDGALLRTIGRSGNGPGEFNSPGGVAVASNGDLVVSDFYNQRIQKLRADGTFIRQWGETGQRGIRAGKFNYPTDVALNETGMMFVADGYNDRIQVFSPDGRFAYKWGGPLTVNISGSKPGWFKTVTGLTLARMGMCSPRIFTITGSKNSLPMVPS